MGQCNVGCCDIVSLLGKPKWSRSCPDQRLQSRILKGTLLHGTIIEVRIFFSIIVVCCGQ